MTTDGGGGGRLARLFGPRSALWPVLVQLALLVVGLGLSVGMAFEVSNRCRFDCGVLAHEWVRVPVVLAPVGVPVVLLLSNLAIPASMDQPSGRGAALRWGLTAAGVGVVLASSAWFLT